MARNIFIVRLVQAIPELEGFDQVLNSYWDAVRNQLERQQIGTGAIRHIFIETVPGRGEDARVDLQGMNPAALSLVQHLTANGAEIQEFEDKDLLAELIDWGICASQQLTSNKVRQAVATGHAESVGLRNDHLAKRLNDTIKDGDTALVLAVSSQLPIPDSIERFIVSPPELDQLERWLRAKMEEVQREMMERAQAQTGQQSGTNTGQEQSPAGGLWTPP